MATAEANRRPATREAVGSTERPVPESRQLADAYADRHERLDEFIVMYVVPGRLLRKLGIELQTPRGYLALGMAFFLAIFLPALVIGLITSSWAPRLAVHAVLIAGALAFLNVLAFTLAQSAAYRISAMHRALANEDEIRTLMDWDRRWYSPTMSALVGGACAVAFMATLYYATLLVSGVQLSPTTLWFCAVVALFLGQFSFSTAMIFAEFHRFTRARFVLYALSPIDTRALQVTSAGLKQIAIVSVVLIPLFYLVVLTVLPEGSNLNVPIMGGFLLLGYLATAVGTLLPLKFLGDIVNAERWRWLDPLQARLNEMIPRLTELPKAEYHEYERLKSLHDSIAASKDSLLGFEAVARIGGAILASTATVIATTLVQS